MIGVDNSVGVVGYRAQRHTSWRGVAPRSGAVANRGNTEILKINTFVIT